MSQGESYIPTLSTPIRIGSMELQHRVVMAPMTRLRSSSSHVPLDMARAYYSQRASMPGTLLITEATYTSPRSCGRDANAPGIFSQEQIVQWKTIVEAVHSRECFTFCQLWHVGRAARAKELQRHGLECLSSSAVRMPDTSPDEYATPRAMTEDEIRCTIEDFAVAAKNAVEGAGFDGVEIHAANGYLIDQFTQPTCNQRNDQWGGSIENRSRLCAGVVHAVCEAIGPARVGVRLSPFSPFQGMGMQNPIPQFTNLIKALREMKLGYLHLVEPRVNGNIDRQHGQEENLDFAFEAWNNAGPVVLAGGFTPESAQTQVAERHSRSGANIAIAFGRYFTSNPDLPRRILDGVVLSPYNRETFYTVGSAKGYVDYGFWPPDSTHLDLKGTGRNE